MDRNSPTAGLSSRKSVFSGVPAQNRHHTRMEPKTSAVPRSGCAMTSIMGTPTTASGFHSANRFCGGSRHSPSTRESISTTATLPISDVCRRTGPTWIQLAELSAVPAPPPMNSVSRSSTRAKA